MTDSGFSRYGDAGFTLLELLVALALAAVIATTMAVAITQLHSMQAAQQQMEEREAAAAIVDVIARDIRSVARLPLLDGASNTNKLLIGAPQAMTFSAVVPTGFQRRALREVTYEVKTSSIGVSLRRKTRMRRFSRNDGASDFQVTELWLGNVKFQLRYLEVDAGGSAVWRDRFVNTNSLPIAVSINLVLGNDQRRAITRTVAVDAAGENE